MGKSHAGAWKCVAIALVAAAYSLAVFTLKAGLDISAWTLYAFTMISFALLGVQQFFGAGGVKPSPHFDLINSAVALAYTSLQTLVFGVLLMFLPHGLSFGLIMTLEALLLAAYLVYLCLWNVILGHANQQEQQMDQALTALRLVAADLELAAARQPEGESKERLHRMAKELRYQDVLVAPELAPLNERIAQCAANLCADDGEDDLPTALAQLETLLAERKAKSRVLKR